MHPSLFTLALGLSCTLGIFGEPIAIRRRDHIARDDASTSQNTTHSLEKRYGDCRYTWYETGLGACGKYNYPSEAVVALNAAQWQGGAHCGKTISISFGGKTRTAKIVDLCPSCGGCALDLSESLFASFNDLGVGVFQGSWEFTGSGSGGSGGSGGQRTTTTTTRRPRTTTSTTTRARPTPTTTSTRTPTTTSTTSTTSTTRRRPRTTSTSTSTTSTSTRTPARAFATSSTTPSPTTTSTSTTTTISTSLAPLPSDLPGGTDIMNMINVAILALGRLIITAAENNNLGDS